MKFIIFILLHLFVCILEAPSSGELSSPIYIAFILVICAVSGIAYWRLEQERSTVFTITFYAYFIYMYLIPGLVQSTSEFYWYHSNKYTDFYQLIALIMTLLFIVVFEASRQFQLAKVERKSTVKNIDKMARRKAGWYAFASISVSVAMTVFLFAILGGSLFITRGAFDDTITSAAASSADIGITIAAPRLAILTSLIFSALFIRVSILTNQSLIFPWVMFIVALLINFISNNPIAIARSQTMVMVIFSITTLMPPRQSRTKIAWILAVPVILYAVFPAITMFNRLQDASFELSLMSLGEALHHGDFDGWQSTLNVVQWTSETGIVWGKQIISSFLYFIPRDIWPSKAIATGSIAAEYAGYLFINVSCPLPAEFYADFGFVGVFLGAALFGSLVGWMEKYLNMYVYEGGITLVCLISIVCAGTMIAFLRGSLLVAMSWLSIYVISTCVFVGLGFVLSRVMK